MANISIPIVFDEERLKELVEEAAARIKAEMCENCPYKDSKEDEN